MADDKKNDDNTPENADSPAPAEESGSTAGKSGRRKISIKPSADSAPRDNSEESAAASESPSAHTDDEQPATPPPYTTQSAEEPPKRFWWKALLLAVVVLVFFSLLRDAAKTEPVTMAANQESDATGDSVPADTAPVAQAAMEGNPAQPRAAMPQQGDTMPPPYPAGSMPPPPQGYYYYYPPPPPQGYYGAPQGYWQPMPPPSYYYGYPQPQWNQPQWNQSWGHGQWGGYRGGQGDWQGGGQHHYRQPAPNPYQGGYGYGNPGAMPQHHYGYPPPRPQPPAR